MLTEMGPWSKYDNIPTHQSVITRLYTLKKGAIIIKTQMIRQLLTILAHHRCISFGGTLNLQYVVILKLVFKAIDKA